MNKEDYFLLQKISEGQLSAMEVLYIRYAHQVKSFACAILKNEDDAEDIVQDVFLLIWDKRKQCLQADNFKSYLFTMTRNLIYNKLKRRKNHDKFVDMSEFKPQTNNPEERIETKDILEHIRTEVSQMTEQQKVIYFLSRHEELTYKEIAEVLQISPKTVQYHIGNILSRLKEIKTM